MMECENLTTLSTFLDFNNTIENGKIYTSTFQNP
jgi:hypothetical protein